MPSTFTLSPILTLCRFIEGHCVPVCARNARTVNRQQPMQYENTTKTSNVFHSNTPLLHQSHQSTNVGRWIARWLSPRQAQSSLVKLKNIFMSSSSSPDHVTFQLVALPFLFHKFDVHPMSRPILRALRLSVESGTGCSCCFP